MERINFLSCPVDNLDIPGALSWMEKRINQRIPSTIAVVNANKYWEMSKDVQLRQFVQNSDLIVAEWAVYWGAARLGTPLKSYIPGVKLLMESLPWAEQHGFHPFFLGATPEVNSLLPKKIKNDFPGLIPAGFHHGFLRTAEDHNQVTEAIKKSRPDILFVAMGSPKQEYWLAENAKTLKVPVSMGVGGSFDVLAGIKKDTPRWARGNGIEWLYRLSQDPGAYWKRYLFCNTWFLKQVCIEFFKSKYISK